MSTTLPPIERDVLTALQRGDEESLERLFRGRFAELTRAAERELRDAARASRVVEGAFIRLWDERADVPDAEAIDAFLRDAVHEGTVRERSRLAAIHRFEAHEGVRRAPAHPPARAATVDEAWEEVVAALHAAPPTADAVEVRARMLRHDAAQHMQRMVRKKRSAVPFVVGGLFAVVVGAGFWWLNRASAETIVTRAVEHPDARVLMSQVGQRAFVTLGDGSDVSLGSDTKLFVPPNFGESLRAAKLVGTARLVIASTPERPFELRAGTAAILITGTELDVSAFPEDSGVLVRVRKGSVIVRHAMTERPLGASQAVFVARGGEMREPTADELEQALGWADGRFMVAGRKLRDVLPLLARWYRLELTAKDPALLDRVVTMRAGLGTSQEAIDALETAAAVKVVWEDEDRVIVDAPPVAPPAR